MANDEMDWDNFNWLGRGCRGEFANFARLHIIAGFNTNNTLPIFEFSSHFSC
jgi:hypothetical protein